MSDPSHTAGPTPQPDPVGTIGNLTNIVKGLSLTNVLIIALLAIIAIPTYILYRALNDESMLNKFLSRYEEIASDKMPCTLRVASVRGGGDIYSISTGFAYQGADRYTVGVIMERRPDESELESYCATLGLIVDYMRRPGIAPSPKFPHSEEELIWHYPPEELP